MALLSRTWTPARSPPARWRPTTRARSSPRARAINGTRRRRAPLSPGARAEACRHLADSQALLALLDDAADSGRQARWLPSRLIPHRDCPRAELQPAHEPQVDMLR